MTLEENERDNLFDILISYFGESINEETEKKIRNDIKDYLTSIGKRDFDMEVNVSEGGIEVDLHPHIDDTDLTLKIKKQSTII